MADTLTTNYGWVMPQDQGSPDTWGLKLNADLQAIDAQVFANAQPQNNVTVISSASAGGTFSFFSYQGAASQQLRWQWQIDTTAETGTTNGSHLNLLAYDNTGAPLVTPLTMVRGGAFPGGGVAMTINASATFTQPVSVQALTVASGLTAGPAISVSSTANAAPTLQLLNSSGSVISTMSWGPETSGVNNRGSLFLDNPSSVPVSSLTLDYAGNLNFVGSGTAYKAGGGSWTAPSDARLKTVDGEYQSGLAAVLALRPVHYTYKGNDGHGLSGSFVGLVAQEVEDVMPEMVGIREGIINGRWVNDLRITDTSSLIFALVNAIKELKAELDELKAAAGFE